MSGGSTTHPAYTAGFYAGKKMVEDAIQECDSADAQALTDVRTLDDWAAMRPPHDPDRMAGWRWSLEDEGVLDAPDRFLCELRNLRNLRCPEDEDGACFRGATPDEARAKAAAWVRSQK